LDGIRQAALFVPGLLKRLYDWVLSWAEHPRSGQALFLIAVAEASFFPIPPDVLLMALSLSRPQKAFHWALVCAAGSVLGGMVGYALGWNFMAAVGQKILNFYGLEGKYALVQAMYQDYDAWAVAAGGFTPLPYKLFTITAGAFAINFGTFVIASILSRSARFFFVAGLIYYFGPSVKRTIDRYFNLFTVILLVLLVGGYLVLRWLL
jgi:membrane protein YqaA with SNARE-associated domain